MFFKKKQEVVEEAVDNFLLYVPHKKHMEWVEKKGKVYLIFHHNHPVQKVANWLVKKSNTTDLELDDMGSAVWKAIDGKRNVYEIGEEIKRKFGDNCEPLYERLIMFVRYLNRRGWIYFENKEAKLAKQAKRDHKHKEK